VVKGLVEQQEIMPQLGNRNHFAVEQQMNPYLGGVPAII
jgi:hypothetical protein